MIRTPQIRTREKVIARWMRHARVYKGIAATSVTFHERGGTTAYVTDFCANKNRNGAKSVPTWLSCQKKIPRAAGA